MLIVGCSKGGKIARKVARLLKKDYSSLIVKKFPDNETYVRFNANVKGKDVVLIQSFFPNVNELLMETLFAAYTAKDLGAKRVRLVATYFPYFRQDKRFNSGESVSIQVLGKVFSRCLDEFIVINPHLHRMKSLHEAFKIKSKIVTTRDLIHDYLMNKIDGHVFIGPDKESRQWISRLARRFHTSYIILNKKRLNAEKVKIGIKNEEKLRGRKVIILDDIVSTGHTLLETARLLKKIGVKEMYFICTHGLFVNNSIQKLRKYGRIIASNTVENKFAVLDVSGLIAESLR